MASMSRNHDRDGNSAQGPRGSADQANLFVQDVRQELAHLRSALHAWQGEYLERLRAPASPLSLPTRTAKEGSSLDRLELDRPVSERPVRSERDNGTDPDPQEDDRLQFLKQRLARQLGNDLPPAIPTVPFRNDSR
jgi:hypothetical protein